MKIECEYTGSVLNNRKSYVFILLLIFPIFIACTNTKQEGKNIDFGFEKLQQSTLNESISRYSIAKLETNDESKINIIKKVIIEDDRIYVLNYQESKQEIQIFSMTGKYINKISKQGRSGKEFSGIIDFDINPLNGDVITLDQKRGNLGVYRENTEFIEDHKINCQAKEIALGMKDGKVFTVLHTEPTKEGSNGCSEITTYKGNNILSKTFFPLKKTSNSVQSKSNTLMKSQGKVLFLRDGMDKLYEIDENGRTIKYNLSFPKPVLPVEKRYDAFYSGQVDLSNYVYDVDYFETDNILYISFSSVDGHFIGIYHKDSESSSLYNMLLDPKCKCGVKINIVGTYQNKFIVQIPRTQISNVLSILDSNRSKCTNPEIFKMIDEMKPGENPILLLLQFNIN